MNALRNDCDKGEDRPEHDQATCKKIDTSLKVYRDSAGDSIGNFSESKVCSGIFPVKVSGMIGTKIVATYALMDNRSEVAFHEDLAEWLELSGDRVSFTLNGMTGSSSMQGQAVNVIVKFLDEATAVELLNVKTVNQMPISPSCIPQQEDLNKWSHLCGLHVPVLKNKEVVLLIGVKERPSMFLPLEYKMDGDTEPIAIRYSLGWVVMDSMGRQKEDCGSAVNFICMSSNLVSSVWKTSINLISWRRKPQ